MQVKCVLCDIIKSLDDHALEAKRLRNRRMSLYLCDACDKRISEKTEQRHATGNFHLYSERKDNDFI